MMIDAVMYGMIPSANTANWVIAPPENTCRKLRTPPWSARFCRSFSAPRSMPGTGTWDPNRYRAIIIRREEDLVPEVRDLEHVPQAGEHRCS